MTEYLCCHKFTLNTKVTSHMEILGMVSHQPWLNKYVAYGTLHLAVRVLVEACGSSGASLLGLDWGAGGRRGAGCSHWRRKGYCHWREEGGCHWTLL